MIFFTTPRRSFGAASAVLLSFILAARLAVPEIIPSSRSAPWQSNVGVPGGIPNRTRIYKNIVTDLGTDPTGVKDCSAIIQSAINNCPKGQVIYIPEGRFRVETAVHIANNKPNVTLRGAGMGRTVLFGPNNNLIFTAGDPTWPPPEQSPSNWISITAGATKGSNTISVGNTKAFVVGAPLAIGPNVLPSWAHNLGGFPDTLRSMRVYFKIRSKTANTVTFDPACPFDFSGMNPMALVDGTPYLQGVGIESLTLDMAKSTAGFPIWMQQVWGCWAKDVEIKGAYTRQMAWGPASRCEVRGCYTHDVQAAGPNHEGISFGQASWNLIEDNIANNGGNPGIMLLDGATAASCNVIGYNYVVNTASGFWDISFCHGMGSLLNLAEGNVIHDYEDDGYFGSSSYGTLFRNRIDGQLKLKHFSNYYNIVGNVLGDSWANTYEADVANYWNSGIKPVYELGFPNIGNVSYTGTLGPNNPPDYSRLPNTLDGCQQLDRNVRATILRHGNWDAANKHIVWDASITDHTIPDSLYYSDRPAWWPAGVPWPPIGPDRDPMVSQIPAQIRFVRSGGLQPAATPPPLQKPDVTSASEQPTPPVASRKGWKRTRSSPVRRRL